MANIESKLTTIKSAAGGEDVREAIIGALRDINNDVPADMSNPVHIQEDMPPNSDLIKPLNPPQLVSQIYIRQPGSGGKSTRLVEATITENGTYPTADKDDGGGSYDPDKENRYYSKVTVKVPQLANAVLDLEEEITQNGTYSAPADWGVDGLRTFTVNVSGAGGDGPFQVEFYDKPQTDPTATVIETQLVSYGGSAQNVKTPPTSDIGVFTGWNPSPNYVTRDMKCYPIFGQIIVDPTDITDKWDVIVSKKGVGYPLGSHAVLAYGATFTADEIKTWYPDYSGDGEALEFYMMMYKVAEGEGNSHSTWLSSAININDWINHVIPWQAYYSWPDGSLKNFLNSGLFGHMSSIFKNGIVPVTKHSIISDGTIRQSQDNIWLPGTSEIGTYQTTPPENPNYDFTNSESWTGNYVNNIGRLDSISTKYVRDYLNNDRNFVYQFLHNHLGQSYGAFIPLRLRDIADNGYFFYREDSGPSVPLIYQHSWTCNYINIGFCL